MSEVVMSRFSLDGKRALVTGASSGLGVHFARALAEAGADVAIAARRKDRLTSVAAKLEILGRKIGPVAMDVTETASVNAAFEEAERALGGGIDIVINNAGVPSSSYFADMPDDEWRQVMDVNLDGVFRVGREAAKRMKATGDGGSIINIASILGFAVIKALSPYAASKAAVVQLTKAMALELARDGIRVNAIAPGYFATEMNSDFLGSETGQKLLSRVPMKRPGALDELTGPLLLLASDAGAFMTGSVVTVDGGHLLATG